MPQAARGPRRVKVYPDRYPMNEDSIGIEVVGKHDKDKGQYGGASKEQLKSVKNLVEKLQKDQGLKDSDVYKHGDVSYKAPSEGKGLGYD